MNALKRLLALTTLAFALVLASAATAFAASSLGGVVTDSYYRTPAQGVLVTLVRAESADSLVATMATAADGTYRFTDLDADSYLLAFNDPLGRFWTEWWDAEPIYEWADPIELSADSSQTANAALWRVHTKVASRLSTPTVSAGSTTTPQISDLVEIETTCTDTLWNTPESDMRVRVEVSINGAAWKNLGYAEDWYDGTYHYSYTPSVAEMRLYRFTIADATDAYPVTSATLRINSILWPTTWTPASLDGTSAVDIKASVGTTYTVRASLKDRFGNPFVSAGVVLQGSTDNKSWHGIVVVPQVSGVPGQYAAVATAGTWTFFRLWLPGVGNNAPAASSAVTLRSSWLLKVGGPTSAKAGRVTLSGNVTPPLPSSIKVRMVYQRWNGRSWRGYKTTTPTMWTQSNNKTYFYKRMPMSKGTYRWRAEVPGDAYRTRAISSWRSLKVR